MSVGKSGGGREWTYSNGATNPPGGHKHLAPGDFTGRWEWPSVWHPIGIHERGELPHTHENPYEPTKGLIIFTDGISI